MIDVEAENLPFKPLREVFRREPGREVSTLGSGRASRCSPAVLADRARVLVGCYRQGEAADPEVYLAALAAIMAEYPEDIVRVVTDPRSGLPSRSKWLPTVCEVRAECDRIAGDRARTVEASRRREQQFAEREAFERRERVPMELWDGLVAECATASPVKRRLSVEDLAAAYAENPCTLSEETRGRWNKRAS